MKSMGWLLPLLLSLGTTVSLCADIPYRTFFEDVDQQNVRDALEAVSQLHLLEEHPPLTAAALRRRAEADLPNLTQGLQALGYYDPQISFLLDLSEDPAKVFVQVVLGPPFQFRSIKIINEHGNVDFSDIKPKLLGIDIGRTAYPSRILEAENRLVTLIALRGYPLVKIAKREVLASKEEAAIDIVFTVDTGPLLRFGAANIQGLEQVDRSVINKKIQWKRGEIFDPQLVDKTQEAIESTGLFDTVIVSHPEETIEGDLLPVLIEVKEAKQRTLALGFSYTTQLGPGGVLEWEHRNMRNRGEKLSLEVNANVKKQNACLSYTFYDLFQAKRDLLLITEAEQQQTKGFTEKFVSLSGLIEEKPGKNISLSYGLSFKELLSEHSNDSNGTFTLLKAPTQVRWSSANNLLDPTEGITVNYKVIPTQSLRTEYSKKNEDSSDPSNSGNHQNPSDPSNSGNHQTPPTVTSFHYFIHTLTVSSYVPLTRDHRIVLAGKIMGGSIMGAREKAIPAPERFYAGSENCLRGYGYLTVSPLDTEGQPAGGRSLLVTSLELRARWSDSWGGVLFWDAGNVEAQTLPRLGGEVRQSVGGGIRYFTLVGPLRLDVAFPLNKRKGLDNSVQLYFSVGQSF